MLEFIILSIRTAIEIIVFRLRGSPKCTSTTLLNGKTAVVTGANTGIGKETARDLSRRGARVILACRDLKRAEEAAGEIRADTGGQVIVRKLDLASLASVRKFAQELLTEESKIHILVNNAGVMACPRKLTEDGFEMQLGVNHLGHFLLTNLLLERIKESAPARIINVSSIAHRGYPIDFSDLMMEKDYEPMNSYFRTKLANILFTKELAHRLQGTEVTVYAPHPGLAVSEIGRNVGHKSIALHIFYRYIVPHIGKTSVEGAQTLLHCALDDGAGKETGLYYNDCEVTSTHSRANDEAAAKRLWEESERLVKLK